MKWAQLAWLNTLIAFSTTFAVLLTGPASPAFLPLGVLLVTTGIGACVCVALALASFIDEIETLRLIARQQALGHHPTPTPRPRPRPELPEAPA